MKVIWEEEREDKVCKKYVRLAINAAVHGTLPGMALTLYEVWRGRLPRLSARFNDTV